jgi:hypothetical protein
LNHAQNAGLKQQSGEKSLEGLSQPGLESALQKDTIWQAYAINADEKRLQAIAVKILP